MESELSLHVVSESPSRPAVIFLHGVNGDHRRTWTNDATECYWPLALASASGWSTYSLQYDANTNWGRTTMPLQERARSVAELLRDAPALAGTDLAFVGHSFGGLVLKQMLRYVLTEPRYADLRERLAGVVFVATPHSGADIASYGSFLRFALGTTVTLEDLRAHAPLLNELGQWYRQCEGPRAHVLYETRGLKIGLFGIKRWLMVVNRDSADPGLRGATVIPVDADHAEISKPTGPAAVQFSSTLSFLREAFVMPARLARLPMQAGAVCYRRTGSGVEFLLVLTTGGRWTIPKGGIESELGLAGSAQQEALEEAGVTGRIAAEPLTHYLHGKREKKQNEDKAMKFCVAAFLLEVQNDQARTPESGRTPTWFAPEETKRRLCEDRAVRYQEEFKRLIDAALCCIAPQRTDKLQG